MKATFVALTSIAMGVQAQMGAPAGLKPSGAAPAGCIGTSPYKYEVQNVQSPSKRDLEKRVVDCSNPNALIVQLNNGVLTDSHGRIGEIVANRQFQFDGPPAQAGTIYDDGWSVCPNMSLAIGSTTVFYQCLSGSFYNLYDQPVGAGCVEIHQQLLQCADSGTAPVSSSSSAAPVTTSMTSSSSTSTSMSSSMMTTSVVSQVSDGQPQASSAPVATQISDGQPQATSPSNATVTTSKPVPTGGATQFVASGAVIALGAVAALFL